MSLKNNQLPDTLASGIYRRQLLGAAAGWCLAGNPISAADPVPLRSAEIVYEAAFQSWTLKNDIFQAVLRLNASTGVLQLEELRNLLTNEVWRLPSRSGSFPILVELADGRGLSGETRFLVTGQTIAEAGQGGKSLTLELSEEDNPLMLTISFFVYPGQAVLRHQAAIANRLGQTVVVKRMNFLAWNFADDRAKFDTFAVHQWVVVPREANFDPQELPLVAGGAGVTVSTGSGGSYCSWLALRDAAGRGLYAGLEFNGRADLSIRQADDRLTWSAEVQELNHPLLAGATMELPAAMLGLFRGDWDEAGYRTQRYVEAVLAPPIPDNNFPYVAWDSWGYLQEINEEILRENAKVAARLGIELFIVDLGWATAMGDWRADDEKFPSGLRALSDYVHDLGMKFGLHFAFSEADPQSSVLQLHPNWTSTETYNFHGAVSMCLGHQPARDWIIEQGVNLIRNYRVDWVLQDGQTLVKQCSKTTHSHHPANSNWANSEEGLDVIVSEIRRRTGVVWENCANGGSMMTFKMVRNYVTSITNDASGSLGSRQGVYGATFPFPPRFADRYMPDQDLDTYTTRSFMFGGPWIFMNRLPELRPQDLALAAREIAIYKATRAAVRDGRVSHLTGRPAPGQVDAIQSYNESRDTALVIVTRESAPNNRYTLRLRNLVATRQYQVRFETATGRYVMSGAQLMTTGVEVSLPERLSAEIVYVEPAGR